MAVEEQDISIDSKGLASWDINLNAPIAGLYQGTFKFRTGLSPLQEIEADRDYRDLLGKNAEFAASHIENLAYTLAQLRHRVVEYPPFWNDGTSRFPGSHIRDKEVLEAVFEASVMAEQKYRSQLAEKTKISMEKMKKYVEKLEEDDKINKEVEKDSEKA